MRVARRLVISGFVQGVGFRYFAQNAAVREGVTGWVQNLPDGRVEAYVEGEDASVERVERALRRALARAGRARTGRARRTPGGALTGLQDDPMTTTIDLKQQIRNVPDFPKPGILFYDITTLLRDPKGFKATVDSLASPYVGRGIELVIGIESRGFILGAAGGANASAQAWCRSASRASCRHRSSKKPTTSSTGPTRSRCTPTPSSAGSAC